MTFFRAVKRRIKEAVPPVIFLALTGYFGWNATQGELGLKSYAQQLALLDKATAARASAVLEQQSWRQRVEGLRDAALDADTIDERSRAMLNLAEPDEVVVPYGPNDKLF
jgi:cell division protein FtsB